MLNKLIASVLVTMVSSTIFAQSTSCTVTFSVNKSDKAPSNLAVSFNIFSIDKSGGITSEGTVTDLKMGDTSKAVVISDCRSEGRDEKQVYINALPHKIGQNVLGKKLSASDPCNYPQNQPIKMKPGSALSVAYPDNFPTCPIPE